jgi:fatty acid desaturase
MNSYIGNTAQARHILSAGIEPQIQAIHTFRHPMHLVYLFYPLLAVLGEMIVVNTYGREWGWNSVPFQYGFGVLVVALGINAMFLLVHEGVHNLLLPNPFWNYWLSVLMAGCGFCSFSAYRVLHLRHHDNLGSESDPDDYRNYTSNPILLWALHYNRLVWATLLYLVLVPRLAWRYGCSSDRRRIIVEYLLIGSAFALLLHWVPIREFALAWLIPFLIANFMINVRGLTQHGLTEASDPFLASRTVLPHPIIQFLLVHENFHLEHHLYPGVPSYYLGTLHLLIRERLPRYVFCPSYSHFLKRFVYASLRNDDTPIGLVEKVALSNHAGLPEGEIGA